MPFVQVPSTFTFPLTLDTAALLLTTITLDRDDEVDGNELYVTEVLEADETTELFEDEITLTAELTATDETEDLLEETAFELLTDELFCAELFAVDETALLFCALTLNVYFT